jgi:hypothetical protein
MKYLIITILGIITTSCASMKTGTYRQENWAHTNYAEAHNDCKVKASVALGKPVCEASQWFCYRNYNLQLADFMHECMAGQGYVWTENH